MSQPASTVDRFLKLSVGAVLLMFFVAPALSMMFTFNAMTSSVNDIWNKELDGRNKRADGILAGASEDSLKALGEKLQGLTAYAGEAKSAASILQFVVVNFDGDGADENVFKPLTLDLTKGEETAVVVIPNRPIAFTVKAPATGFRARFAVESATPFDIIEAPKGVLAGYHVPEFSGGTAALPRQYLKGSNKRAFCDAAIKWVKFYGVRWSKVRIAALNNPSMVELNPYGVINRGELVAGLPSLSVFCS